MASSSLGNRLNRTCARRRSLYARGRTRMFGIVILMVVATIAWRLLTPTPRFLSGFASLLNGAHTDHGLVRSLAGRSFVNGRFGDRAVQLSITQPYEHRIGEIVVSMETHAPKGEPWKDPSETRRHPEIDRATFALEGKYGLILTNDDGWLRATSRPLLLTFPGDFDPEKWGSTLADMQVLAEWLEGRG